MLASDVITLGAAIFALLGAVAGSSACAYGSSRNGRINIAVLKAKVFALDNLISSFQRQLAGIAIINPNPTQWVSKARTFLDTIDVPELEESVKEKCLSGWIPNYCTQFCAGRLIESMISELDVLLEEGHRISRDSTVKGHKQPEVSIVGATRIQITGEIWRSVSDPNSVGCVSIHGIVGVGKTAIAALIHNQALAEDEIFDYVIWVPVKYGVGLWQIQEDIASSLGIDIASISDTSERARRISSALTQKSKFLLVLDSVWQAFSLKDIGIPEPTGGSKLLITSRIGSVCKRIVPKKIFEVKPLPEEEALELFESEVGPKLLLLGDDTVTDTEGLVRDLDGLPLAIKMLAQILSEIHEDYYSNKLDYAWKEELRALRQGGVALLGHRDQELFDCMKHSFDYLRSETRSCFLFCALYPRGHPIDTRELIEYWVWEGFLGGETQTLEAIMRHGKETLKELKDAHLLESVVDEGREESVKILNTTRLMAIKLMDSLGHKVLIRSGESLTDFPAVQDWPADVERVSMMKNHLKSLNPKSKPSNCRKLSTLLLQDNPLDFIPTTNRHPLNLITTTARDNFFYGMRNLKVLDLSRTLISTLPSSVFYSVNLRALLLRNCLKLTTLYSLSRLVNLIVLDLQGTPLEHCPDGMQYLSKLRRLDMSRTRLDTFPSNVIGKLKQLEELYLITDDRGGYLWGSNQVDCKWRGACVEELAELIQLRVVVLQLNFLNAIVFNKYTEACNKLKEEKNAISSSPRRFKYVVGGFHTDGYGGFGENSVTVIGNYLVSLPDGTSELFLMMSNEKITALQMKGCFRDLSLLDVSNFSGLKSLLRVNILGSMRNLRRISVRRCEEMVEVVQPDLDGNPSTITLPELTVIILYDLPKLESVCRRQVLNCPRLCSFEVWGCGKLKLPMMLGRKRGKIEIKGEKSWIDELEWDNPNNANGLFQDKPDTNTKFRLVNAAVPEGLVSSSRMRRMERIPSATSAPEVLQRSDATSTSNFLRRPFRFPAVVMPRAISSNVGDNNRNVSGEGRGSGGTLRQVLNMVNVVNAMRGTG